jgi:hypothetical protein
MVRVPPRSVISFTSGWITIHFLFIKNKRETRLWSLAIWRCLLLQEKCSHWRSLSEFPPQSPKYGLHGKVWTSRCASEDSHWNGTLGTELQASRRDAVPDTAGIPRAVPARVDSEGTRTHETAEIDTGAVLRAVDGCLRRSPAAQVQIHRYLCASTWT